MLAAGLMLATLHPAVVSAEVSNVAAVTITPVADSYVLATQSTTNYGSSVALRTDGDPITRSYLRFTVQGRTGATSVKLRIYAETANTQGIQLHPVTDNSWTESGITYTNAPAPATAIAASGPITAGTWLTFDVTSLVTADGPASFALTSPSTTATQFSARTRPNPPQLVITTGTTGPSPFVVTRMGDTYTAVSESDGTSFSGSLKVVVESAVAAMKAAGGPGEIRFSAGTFDFGADYFRFVKVNDVTFTGAGMDVTVLQNVSSAEADTEPFNFEASDRITIRDLTVSAGGPVRPTSDALDFDGGDDILIERVKVVLARGRGIVFDGKDDPNITGGTALRNVIRGCVITGGVAKSGIELLATGENRVEGCTITDVGLHGIHVNKASVTAFQANKPSTDNVVSGNTVVNAAIDGVNVSSGHRNRIVGNTIRNSSDDVAGRGGIWIASAEAGLPCDANVVENNTATDDQTPKTQRYGLAIAHPQCTGNVVGNNDFSGNIAAGVLDAGTATTYTDTSGPTAPTNVAASNVTASSVALGWGPSTDNYGVSTYRITRNGTVVGTVPRQTLAFTDVAAAPSTTYTYTVVAVDAAGNASGASNAVTVTTGPAAAVTITPVADSYVLATQPTTNYGSSVALRTDGDPITRSYLRFTVQGRTGATSVKLRIYAETANTQGIQLHPVTDNSWTESGITYTNAPAPATAIAASGPITAGTWLTFDVTSLVTADGPASLALTSPSTTATQFSARTRPNPPQLVITGSAP